MMSCTAVGSVSAIAVECAGLMVMDLMICALRGSYMRARSIPTV